MAGIDALEGFIREIGLPGTLEELGVKDEAMRKKIAESCHVSLGGYRRLTQEEILDIFRECS